MEIGIRRGIRNAGTRIDDQMMDLIIRTDKMWRFTIGTASDERIFFYGHAEVTSLDEIFQILFHHSLTSRVTRMQTGAGNLFAPCNNKHNSVMIHSLPYGICVTRFSPLTIPHRSRVTLAFFDMRNP